MVVLSLTGPYRITDYACDMRVVLTNKCGAAPMRAPMSIASWVMDGTIEAVARALHLDPIAVRRRNMLTAAELPWTMPAGPVLEDVTPRETLEAVLAAFDVPGFRARQDADKAPRRVSRHGPVLRGGVQYLRLSVLSCCGNSRLRPRGRVGEGRAQRRGRRLGGD